jgi:hypothetical protein
MEFVIPVVLVVLAIGGFVTFFVLNATKKSGPAADADEGAPGIGADDTPLGDTTEHAGEQTESGVTASDPESGARSGRSTDPDAAAHVGRRGEGEGEERLEFEGEQPRPASERLADRDV